METRSRYQQCHHAASLTGVSDDVLLLVGEACSDPLAPKALAHLANTSRQTLATLQPKLLELRDYRAGVVALCSKSRIETTVSLLAQTEQLRYNRGLTLADLAVLGRLLRSGALPALGSLILVNHLIGDEGLAALAQGLGKGALANMTNLNLNFNNIGDGGMTAFYAAISSGALASLQKLYLHENQIGDEGMQAFSTAISSGAMGSLKILSFFGNQIGDAGMIAFADAIKPTDEFPMGALASLQELRLSFNQIGDEGMKAFSSALSSGSMGSLQQLWLQGNQIGDAGMIAFADALKPNSNFPMGALPSVQTLLVDEGVLGTEHLQLKAACEARGLTLQTL